MATLDRRRKPREKEAFYDPKKTKFFIFSIWHLIPVGISSPKLQLVRSEMYLSYEGKELQEILGKRKSLVVLRLSFSIFSI